MKIVLELGDKVSDRMIKALSIKFGYRDFVADEKDNQIPNSQPREDFVVAELQKWLIESAQAAEIKDTLQVARDDAEEALNTLNQTAKAAAADLSMTVSFQ